MKGRKLYPLDPAAQAAACRLLASVLRREHAMGMDPLQTSFGTISRLDAAVSADAQAERWEHEIRTGEPNTIDRAKIGWDLGGEVRTRRKLLGS